jgi:hypothetical protein
MAAGVAVDEGQIGRDIEHTGVEMAEEAEAPRAQPGHHASRADPRRDPCPGACILEMPRYRTEGDGAALQRRGQFRQGTDAAVFEPAPGIGVGMVHLRVRLQIDQEGGDARTLDDRQHLGRGRVGRQMDHQEIEARRAEVLARRDRLFRS